LYPDHVIAVEPKRPHAGAHSGGASVNVSKKMSGNKSLLSNELSRRWNLVQ
jgi:hypothetical protein